MPRSKSTASWCWATNILHDDITQLRGAGPRIAERLRSIGIKTVQDLLFHLPYRYQDRTRINPIGGLLPGQEILVQGEIQAAQVAFGRRRTLVCGISDGTGLLHLRFFHFSRAQQATLHKGVTIRCFGEARRGRTGLEMVHPQYRLLTPGQTLPVEASLTPIYPAADGLNQKLLFSLSEQALAALGNEEVEELLPRQLLQRFGFPTLKEALVSVHRPSPDISLADLNQQGHPGVQRLAFEELLAQHLCLRRLRQALDQQPAPLIRATGDKSRALLRLLGFELTSAQQRVIREILSDLQRPNPMHRLLQGDVGSGKTVVAALAALAAIEAGYQVALMAPTEILAEQHLHNFNSWFAALGLAPGWLTGKLGAAPRRATLAAIAAGDIPLVIGTHALFQEGVNFARLGLVIVDEQHRFGVEQRLALRNKGAGSEGQPHQLIMTATPIPRTLAMTAYADLDTSVIDELPPGRRPVTTAVIPDSRRAEVVARVHQACRQGQQSYWVCTLIEDSEVLKARAAEDTYKALAKALPDLQVRLVHGRMKPAEKQAVMAEFKSGDSDLLVATTVIEVGVDVTNASLMIIDNAERLGLSQLHQLRGRIGRGARQSVCVLLYSPPLSRTARTRLEVMRNTSDGFEVAQQDLELRGPGEVLGTRQTGLEKLKVADLVRDRALLPQVANAANSLLRHHPENVEALIRRWVGGAVDYATI